MYVGAFPADVLKTLHDANPELDFEGTARRLQELASCWHKGLQ